jgi:hypothetical protein
MKPPSPSKSPLFKADKVMLAISAEKNGHLHLALTGPIASESLL